jgi:hypothetical protein
MTKPRLKPEARLITHYTGQLPPELAEAIRDYRTALRAAGIKPPSVGEIMLRFFNPEWMFADLAQRTGNKGKA